MSFFITLAGLILALVIFIYLLSALDSGKRTLTKTVDPVAVPAASQGSFSLPGEGMPGSTVTHRKNRAVDALSDAQKDMLPERRCPICMSTLNRDQPLYAGNTERDGRRTILVYGCQHCYKEKSETLVS